MCSGIFAMETPWSVVRVPSACSTGNCVRRTSHSPETDNYAPQTPEGVKKVVCASNPTSKLCLKNSFVKK